MKIKRILLIEDEAPHATLFRRNIKRVHPEVEVFVAGDGQEGLDVLKTLPLDDLLILLDLNMPVMSGHEVLESLRAAAEWKDIPVVILTTSDYQRDKDRAGALNISGYLTKPINMQEISAIFTL